ncbi:18713_t:CDS:2 [Funneliformis geosporum]|uniref:(d)CMP kinase n=1 Tax=Funneliformis geosporum TaxID=1117311 RepID=A0A9W4SQ34_9GLOM|nr:14308_t:CDS:2 [Funneliformis geosporum]CAI2178640.1 18713_t:CDS:2 [Funneliformis geosporum]
MIFNFAKSNNLTKKFDKVFYRNLFQLAIDGPAASGKSSTARMAAQQLNFEYIDSGAMYRAVTLAALRQNLSPTLLEDVSKIAQLAATSHIHLHTTFDPPPLPLTHSIPSSSITSSLPQTLVYLNGEDVTYEIRSPEITNNVSGIASNLDVRKVLVEKQRALASGIYDENQNKFSPTPLIKKSPKGTVMDGRDVGTVILPNADLKIFVTASAKVRATRRFKELQQQSYSKRISQIIDFNKVLEDLEKRDKSDYERKISPLKKANDALFLDSSHMSVTEQVDKIVELVLKRAKEKNIDL